MQIVARETQIKRLKIEKISKVLNFQAIRSILSFSIFFLTLVQNGFQIKKEIKPKITIFRIALPTFLVLIVYLAFISKSNPIIQNNISLGNYFTLASNINTPATKQDTSSSKILKFASFYFIFINLTAALIIYFYRELDFSDEQVAWPRVYCLISLTGGSPAIILGTYLFDNRRFNLRIRNPSVDFLINLFLSLIWPFVLVFFISRRQIN